MIVTEQKPFEQILQYLKNYRKIFLVGCGECATTCKTGGEEQLKEMKQRLEKENKQVLGFIIPSAPCVAAQTKIELAKNTKLIKEAEAILVLACGLGVQSVKDNQRVSLPVFPACNSLFGATVDAQGNLLEKCSLCGECVLDFTAGICPITLCAKGLLNGPCGGMHKGKCEVDKEKDCAWVLIYREMEKGNNIKAISQIQKAKDYSRSIKPRKKIIQG